MNMQTINQIFQEKYPNGKIYISRSNGELLDSGKQTGKFAVVFDNNGKIYTYSFKSVYSLAERLGLIPDNNLDYMEESKKAIESMKAGIPFISICGLSDTIRFLLGNNPTDNKSVKLNYVQIENDRYDRHQWIFTSFEVTE